MGKHTLSELQTLQALPLALKVKKTQQRIREWVYEYGIDHVYVSFSGGKDSTVLLHIARQIFPEIKAVFADTGLEFPEIRDFVMTFDNVDIVTPKMTFKRVIEKCGYPMISKEVSEVVHGVKEYLKKSLDNAEETKNHLTNERTNERTNHYYQKLYGLGKWGDKDHASGVDYTRYSSAKYQFLLEAPFYVGRGCCSVMKKTPLKRYETETDRHGITAMMASESKIRAQKWLSYGCNAFDAKRPISNPMSFWFEEDVLLYAKLNDIKLCSVYGDTVFDNGSERLEGQMDLTDFGIFDLQRPCLKTTGMQRTGCVFCGFGCHHDTHRFELIDKVSRPGLRDYCMRGGAFTEEGLWKPTNNGLGMWFVIQWINLAGNFSIYIPEYERYEKEYGTEETRAYLEQARAIGEATKAEKKARREAKKNERKRSS